jgi:hypothetical protein
MELLLFKPKDGGADDFRCEFVVRHQISVAPFHSSMYLAHFPALPRASFHNPRLAVRRAHCTYDHVSPTRTSSLLQVPPVRQD